MKCQNCGGKATRNKSVVVISDDSERDVFCSWACLAGYVKDKGMITRDDFPAHDRC